MRSYIIVLFFIIFLLGCNKKSTPIIKVESIDSNISCIKLNSLDIDKEYIDTLNSLYKFSDNCKYKLTVSYKKDILCNSSYNIQTKSMGKFPKSFLKLELRDGFDLEYSYYIDLYDNVDRNDIIEAFRQMRKDLKF